MSSGASAVGVCAAAACALARGLRILGQLGHDRRSSDRSDGRLLRPRRPASVTPIATPKFGAPPASAPVRSGARVAYRDITIEPDTLKVKVGSTISWTNYDPIEHNVTSEGGPQSSARTTSTKATPSRSS